MSLATGLIAKLLLAISVIPAAGYGGYCAYDHYCPTFHNFMEREGYEWAPIDGNLGSNKAYYQRRVEIFKDIGGDWRCSKQMFLDIASPKANAEGSQASASETGNIPNVPTDTEVTDDDYDGCLVVDLGFPTNNKKAAFIKWELALRSGNRGFIYAGFFSIGKIKDDDGSTTDQTFSQQSNSTVFEVKKDSDKWEIKNGLSWTDYFSSTDDVKTSSVTSFDNAEVKISLPNGVTWESKEKICSLNSSAEGEQCPSGDGWAFKKYVGFWEKNESGQQAIDAIKIVAKTSGDNKEHLHDIWSQTGFDFSKSAQDYGGKPAWGSSVGHIYDAPSHKWKGTNTNSMDATEYLKAIYKPWANKKGTWMEADKVCYASNSRTLKETDEEAKRLKNFCYKNRK